MKCYNCRIEVPEGVKFCPKCGVPQRFTQELIDRAVNDDQEAIGQLYKMTYNNVYFTVKSMIQDEDTILDLVQDTYIKGFKNLSRLKKPQAFRGWIKRIGHNLTVDYLRKKRPRTFSNMVSTDSDEMIDFADERTCNIPEAVMEQKETTRLVNEILDSLSDEQRIVVGMFYYQQMSVKEIAEELGANENTVKSRLSYGRKKIETQVKELEKKGTKLYGLAPIPFLLWLFKSMDSQAAYRPNQEILRNIQSQLAASYIEPEDSFSTRGKSSNLTAEITETATKAAGKGTITKVIIGIVATAIVGGTITGVVALNNKEEPEIQAEVENEIEDEEVNEDVPETRDTETRQELYQNILNQHIEACEINDNEYLSDVEKYTAQYPDVCTEIIPYHQYGMNLHYAYHDIDGNGIEELVIGSEQERGILPVALYTYNENNKQVILSCNSSTFNRSILSIMSDGTMYQYGSGGAEFSGAELLNISEDGYNLESSSISIEEYEQMISERTEAQFEWKILEVNKEKNQSDFIGHYERFNEYQQFLIGVTIEENGDGTYKCTWTNTAVTVQSFDAIEENGTLVIKYDPTDTVDMGVLTFTKEGDTLTITGNDFYNEHAYGVRLDGVYTKREYGDVPRIDQFLGTYANNYYGLQPSAELNRVKCVSGSNMHGGWLVFEYDSYTINGNELAASREDSGTYITDTFTLNEDGSIAAIFQESGYDFMNMIYVPNDGSVFERTD